MSINDDPAPKEPEKECDEFLRHPQFYFEDGSVVLDVKRTLFRVHQSVLARQSEVFRSMFSLKQPNNSPMIDGCPSVELVGDSPKDVEEVLGTLYDPFYFEQLEQEYDLDYLIKFISGILRISAKYDMKKIKKKCVDILVEKFPITLAGCDNIMKSEFRYKTMTLVDAINLAHTTYVPQILPWAYYISTHVAIKDLLNEPKLSWKDKALCLAGKDRLWCAQKTLTHAFLFDFELRSEDCTVGCNPRPPIVAWRDGERLRGSPHPLEAHNKWGDLKICAICQRDFEKRHREARTKFWESLPAIFELGTWDNLQGDFDR